MSLCRCWGVYVTQLFEVGTNFKNVFTLKYAKMVFNAEQRVFVIKHYYQSGSIYWSWFFEKDRSNLFDYRFCKKIYQTKHFREKIDYWLIARKCSLINWEKKIRTTINIPASIPKLFWNMLKISKFLNNLIPKLLPKLTQNWQLYIIFLIFT